MDEKLLMQRLISLLHFDELPTQLKLIADEENMENILLKVIENPNETIYLPSIKMQLRPALKREFINELAEHKRVDFYAYKKYLNCSYKYLRGILKEAKEEVCAMERSLP